MDGERGLSSPSILEEHMGNTGSLWKVGGGRKYLLHTGEANLPDVSGSFQTPIYLPVLLSVPTLHIASKVTKVTEDKQPNY